MCFLRNIIEVCRNSSIGFDERVNADWLEIVCTERRSENSGFLGLFDWRLTDDEI
jgi:hypothetical protein